MTALTQHPLSAAFPAMLAEEFQELRDSINIVGVLNAITLLDGMVLDGWHRYTVATEYGMDCPMVELGDDVDPVDFVKAQNIARRKLTPSQTAFACTQLYAWRPPHREKKVAATATFSKTNAELADIAGTGERTIRQAKAVHAGAVSGVQDAVKAGTVSLETAAAVAKLPAAEQQAIAASGPDAMRAAAKPKTKAAAKSGTSAKATTHVRTTQAKADADQLAQDAHGDTDIVEELENSIKEAAMLRKQVDVLTKDDGKAELMKWMRMCANAEMQRDDAMARAVRLEGELKRFARQLQRIGKAVGEDDTSKIAAIVEAKFCTEAGDANDPPPRDHRKGDQ